MTPLAEYPRTVVLKDGLHVELRPLATTDAAALAAFALRLEPDALAGVGEARAGDAAAVWLIALDGARVAGLIGLVREGAADGAVAELRLGLDPMYRDRRLGTWMLLDAVHLARELGVRRLVTVAPAAAATERAALRRLDFVEDGLAGDGGSLRLVKTLHTGWTDF